MVGKWILQGTIAGQETTHDINIDWVLGHQYVQLREFSREKDSEGRPPYKAIVFITREETQNRYKYLWLDNSGKGGLSAQAIGQADRNRFNFQLNDVQMTCKVCHNYLEHQFFNCNFDKT